MCGGDDLKLAKDGRIRVVSSVFLEKIRAKEIEGHVSSYVLAELYETPDVNKRARLLRLAGSRLS